MKTITPYGVYFYLNKLERLRLKLGEAAKKFLYSPPKIHQELIDLSELKEIEDFHDIGKWAENWYERIKLNGLTSDECKKLYFETKDTAKKFTERVLKYILISPKLEILDPEKIKSGAHGFFDQEKIEILRRSNCLSDFNQACKAILVNMPSAAVLYLCKVLRKLGMAKEEVEKRLLVESFKQSEVEEFFLDVVRSISEGHAHYRSASKGLITQK